MPVRHVKQFKGQQYPKFRVYCEEQLKQAANAVQVIQPAEQAEHTPPDK